MTRVAYAVKIGTYWYTNGNYSDFEHAKIWFRYRAAEEVAEEVGGRVVFVKMTVEHLDDRSSD